MRLDYYHTGTATEEVFSIDRIVLEPLDWPGDLGKAIDDTNLGKYFFEVRDQQTKAVLFSRGFASIYGEWETTDEAKSLRRTFSESLRFPAPTKPVEIVLKKRDAQNAWRNIWTTTIDPASIFIDRSKPQSPARLIPIQKMGDPGTKVDFLILGDGYTAREAKKFEADARRLTRELFATSPFKERRKDFNVWALCPPAAESGISRPSTGIYRDSPLGATYDAFGSERYVLTFDNHALREVAAFARRSGDKWFLAVVNGPAQRTIKVPLTFLRDGAQHGSIVRDDPNDSAAVKLESTTAHPKDSLTIDLVAGGGFIARFEARPKSP